MTSWTAACQTSLSFTFSRSLLKFMSIELMMPSNHLILSPPSLALSLSQHQGLSQSLALSIRWPKCWSFSISPSNEYAGLISLRIDVFDLLAVQGTIRSLLQQFESISSLALGLLYGPTLTFIHDYWRNHSSDSTDHCRLSGVSAFKYTV